MGQVYVLNYMMSGGLLCLNCNSLSLLLQAFGGAQQSRLQIAQHLLVRSPIIILHFGLKQHKQGVENLNQRKHVNVHNITNFHLTTMV